MKFFWKIFYSIIIIASITCSVGSYYLINSQFQYSLEREISTAYDENDILRYSSNRELINIDLLVPEQNQVSKIAKAITVNTSKGRIKFCISDKEGNRIYNDTELTGTLEIFKKLSDKTKAYTIYQEDEKYYIQTIGPIYILDDFLFLENFRDITFLFQAKQKQYQTFTTLMLVLFIGMGIVTFIVSNFLLKPLKKLSFATKQIAGGKFSQRLNINTKDEFGQLASDFDQMAEQLENMVDELKISSRRQQDFVNSFSHELKTPLTSMIGYADMLRSKRMESERVIRCANYIFTEGKRLEALTFKLMDIIILEKQTFSMQDILASEFFKQIQNIFMPIFSKEHIKFCIEADECDLLIETDLMKTVCMNLLDNSRKAIEEGGEIIFSGTLQSDGGYIISIKDNGKGIPESELSKITEAFYMVDKSRARAQGGAGLGLTICSKIISIHNGQMIFQSTEGEGTCVSILLKGVKKVES